MSTNNFIIRTLDSTSEELTDKSVSYSKAVLSQYHSELNHSFLTKKEQMELGYRARKGDDSARKELIMHNLKLAVSMAFKYVSYGLPIEDLIQEGFLGLIYAATTYNPDFKTKFSTYATPHIKLNILRALAKERDPSISQNQNNLILRLNRLEDDFLMENTKKSKEEWLSEKTGLSLSKITLLLRSKQSPVPLCRRISSTEPTEYTLLDFVAGPNNTEIEAMRKVISEELVEKIREILTPRDADIILRYYGLGDYERQTLAEIGEQYGVTKEGIRKLRNKALAALSEDPGIKNLRKTYEYLNSVEIPWPIF